MPHCRRELFDELTGLLEKLDGLTVGPDGFVSYVEGRFYVMPWQSRRVRETREGITGAIGRLRELSGLLSAEVEGEGNQAPDPSAPAEAPAPSPPPGELPPPPPPAEAPAPSAETADERARAEAFAAAGIGPEDAYRIVDGVPVKVDQDDVEAVLDAIEHAERRGDGSPAVTRSQAEALGEWLAGAWDRAYGEPEPALPPGWMDLPPPPNAFPAAGRGVRNDPYPREVKAYAERRFPVAFGADPPLYPAPSAPAEAPPAPPPPAPSAPAPSAPAEAPPAPPPPAELPPPPPPAEAPPPALPPRVESPNVKLIRFAGLTRAHDSAWAIISVPPDNLDGPGAFLASRNIVIDAGAIRNRKSVDKLLSRQDESIRDKAYRFRLPLQRVYDFVNRVEHGARGLRVLQTDAGREPEPVAFELNGVPGTFVAFTPAEGGAPIVMNASWFTFVRGFLAGNKLEWRYGEIPAEEGKRAWRGIFATAKGGARILAVIGAPELTVTDEQWSEIAALRGAGAYSDPQK